jgi:DUF2970 family protein
MNQPAERPQDAPRKVSWWQTTGSVLASFFGVQSESNRERDFSQGSAGRFIFIGVAMTVLFILTLWGIVRLVLHLAGA